MRKSISALLCGASFAVVVTGGLAQAARTVGVPAYVKAAVADSARPAADTDRDSKRKPDLTMAFGKIHPGEQVIELLPGKGYFTRIFSKIVGPKGHVYATTIPNGSGDTKPGATIAGDPNYPNVSDLAITNLTPAGKVDVVFTAQNYHDFHLARLKLDVPALDKQIYDALKPGGEFYIIDHSAVAGTGLEVPDKLHRINEDIVKKEVESAGFKLEAEADFLRNPNDPRDKLVFDPSIRGYTDQFVLRFRKPK